MRRERDEREVRIPIRIRNGKPEFLYDVELPGLKEGALGELVLDVRSVSDPKWQKFLTGERYETKEIAPAGTLIAFAVAVDKGAAKLEKHLISRAEWLGRSNAKPRQGDNADEPFSSGSGFQVLGELLEPLTLRLRGESLSQLSDCAVFIPELHTLKQRCEAPTLNQALVLVSQFFEPERQGHNGDVFREVHLLHNQTWILLDTLRGAHQREDELKRWEAVGLDPQKVDARIQNSGGLFPDESTRKIPPL